MGTSSSSKGGRGRNPLVPDWADDQPGAPLPQPDPNRLRSFRRSFGEYVSGGGRSSLEKSLEKFASQATGGSSIGPRRLGAVISAGGAFAEVLRDVSEGRNVEGLNQTQFEGKSVEQFAQAISQLVCGETPDADWINSALQEAIEAALDFDEDFDRDNLSEENISTILVEFLAISIFQLVLNEAGNAWTKAQDSNDTIKCETEILDLTRQIVDQSFSMQFDNGEQNLASDAVQGYMRASAKEVWEKWERYND